MTYIVNHEHAATNFNTVLLPQDMHLLISVYIFGRRAGLSQEVLVMVSYDGSMAGVQANSGVQPLASSLMSTVSPCGLHRESRCTSVSAIVDSILPMGLGVCGLARSDD